MIERAWRTTGLSLAEKLVLLALADHHNAKEGKAWPSMARLAARTGMDERSCRRALAGLIANDLVMVDRAPPSRNEYRLALNPDGASASKPGHSVTLTQRHPDGESAGPGRKVRVTLTDSPPDPDGESANHIENPYSPPIDQPKGAARKASKPRPAKRKKPAPAPLLRGMRIPPDFTPKPLPEGSLSAAIAADWSDGELAATLDDFRDYWQARAGPGAVKMNWDLTWKRWILKSGTMRNGRLERNGTRRVDPLQTALADAIAECEAEDAAAARQAGYH